MQCIPLARLGTMHSCRIISLAAWNSPLISFTWRRMACLPIFTGKISSGAANYSTKVHSCHLGSTCCSIASTGSYGTEVFRTEVAQAPSHTTTAIRTKVLGPRWAHPGPPTLPVGGVLKGKAAWHLTTSYLGCWQTTYSSNQLESHANRSSRVQQRSARNKAFDNSLFNSGVNQDLSLGSSFTTMWFFCPTRQIVRGIITPKAYGRASQLASNRPPSHFEKDLQLKNNVAWRH